MLENLNQRIEAPTIADHEKELHERLSMVMLAFAEKKYQQDKEKNPDIRISDIIDADTDLFFRLENILKHDRNLDYGQIFTWKKDLQDKIDDIYEHQHDHWMQTVCKLFTAEDQKYQTYIDTQSTKESVGVIRYNLRMGEHGLEEYGFDKDLDQALEIHFDELFKNPDKKLSTREALDSLSGLAEVIIDRLPHIKFVMAESWLMDHPLFKKLGFQVTNKQSNLRTPNHWLQFVDKDGQINQQKVDELLATGQFPYYSRVAYFPIIDFLKKYLPLERRKKPIILKDLKPGFKENGQAIEAEGIKFNHDWPNLSTEDIDDLQNKYPMLCELMSKLNLLDEFKEALKRMKVRNDDWGQGRAKEIDFFKKFEQRRNDYMATEATIEREIIID